MRELLDAHTAHMDINALSAKGLDLLQSISMARH